MDEEQLYIYVVGGRNRGKTVAVVERYSVAQRKWERCPSLMVSRGSHGVASVDGKVYAIAGGGINSNLTSCEVFDPACDTWSGVPSLNTARHALASAAGGGKIYAVGGWVNGNHCSGETECFDTERHSWTQCGAMKVPRRLHGIAELNGELYAFGGIGAENEFQPITDAECYDPSTDSWTKIAPLPQGSYASCCSSGSFVYVFLWGRRLWRYCPKTNTYLDKSALPLPEWYGFAVTAWGSKIYAVGGSTEGRWTGAAFSYDTEANAWEELPPMKTVRRRTGAAACCHDAPSDPLASAAARAEALRAAVGPTLTPQQVVEETAAELEVVQPVSPEVAEVPKGVAPGDREHSAGDVGDEATDDGCSTDNLIEEEQPAQDWRGRQRKKDFSSSTSGWRSWCSGMVALMTCQCPCGSKK